MKKLSWCALFWDGRVQVKYNKIVKTPKMQSNQVTNIIYGRVTNIKQLQAIEVTFNTYLITFILNTEKKISKIPKLPADSRGPENGDMSCVRGREQKR